VDVSLFEEHPAATIASNAAATTLHLIDRFIFICSPPNQGSDRGRVQSRSFTFTSEIAAPR